MANPNATYTVLILEDDPDLREAIEFAFSQHDFRCVLAGTFDEAVTALGAHPIDAIVADVDLPERSGIEFLNFVRADRRTLPFFLMSGAVDLRLDAAIKLGANGFIEKPFSDLRFARRIKAAIEAAAV